MAQYIVFVVAAMLVSVFDSFGYSQGLPIGNIGKSAHKTSTKSIAHANPGNCFDWIVSPMGVLGEFSPDGEIYKQVYLAEPNISEGKHRYVIEEFDLTTQKSETKLSLNIRPIDQAIFSSKREGDGVYLVSYESNGDHCFKGKGVISAVSFDDKAVNNGKIKVFEDRGNFVSYALGEGTSIIDLDKSLSLRYQYKPFVKNHLKVKLDKNQRILWSENTGGQTGYVGLKNKEGIFSLTLVGKTRIVGRELPLKAGDKLVRTGKYFAVLRPLAEKNLMYFMESGPWSGAKKTRVYKVVMPGTIPVGFVSVQFSAKTKTLLLYGNTPLTRKSWSDLYVIDYVKGTVKSTLKFPAGQMAGEVHFDPFGKTAVVEAVDKSTGVRKALNIYSAETGKWSKRNYLLK